MSGGTAHTSSPATGPASSSGHLTSGHLMGTAAHGQPHPQYSPHGQYGLHAQHGLQSAHAGAHVTAAQLGGPTGGNAVAQAVTAGPALGPAPRKLSGRRRRETVAVLLFSGAPIFESSIPLSVFGVDRQDAGVPRYRLLVCAGEDGPLTTTGGLTLTAPYGLEALARAGTIVVPAWRSISQPPPVEAIAALRKAHHEGARIIGLCTGAFVLAAAGLLDGRPATTHWMYAPTLAKRYPRVHVDPRELFVDDGDVLTSAGTAAGIDLCLHVVRSDHGAEAANALARRLVVPNRRSGGGQAQYIDQSLPEEIGNDPLAEVVTWALENLNQQFDVEVLAARAYMSRRTFDRRFRTLTGSAPLQWLITQRVLQAQRLLETSDLSVDDVARRCGFRSPVALRGHFRRQLGVSPAAYRTGYRARRPAPSTTVPAQALPGDRPLTAPAPSAPGPYGGPAGGGVPGHGSPGTPAHAMAHTGPHPGYAAHPAGHPAGAPGGAPHVGGPATGQPSAGARPRVRPTVPPQQGPALGRPARLADPRGGEARAADLRSAETRTAAAEPRAVDRTAGRGVELAGDRARLRAEGHPGGRGIERDPVRADGSAADRPVEHAVADEHSADQPSARGRLLGHRVDRPEPELPLTAPPVPLTAPPAGPTG